MILDLGCGDVDRGDVNLDVRRTKTTNLIASAEHIPLKTASIDLVLSSQVLEHLQNPQSALKEIRRVLKDGGEAQIDVPMPKFTSQSRWQLLRFLFNLPFTLRPRDIKWHYSVTRRLQVNWTDPMTHKSIISRESIQKYLDVETEEPQVPIFLATLENYVNRLFRKFGLKKELKIARVKFMVLYRCKKKEPST